MKDSKVKINKEIIEKYTELDLGKNFIADNKEDISPNSILYKYLDIRKQLLELNDDIYYVVDVIIKHLYNTKDSKYKTTLWSSFGDIVVENLKNNIKEAELHNSKLCEVCGERIEVTTNMKYCSECQDKTKREKTRERVKKHRERQ
jgi:hypothetical protein